MCKRISLAWVLLLSSVSAWGQSMSINLANDSARFFYNTEMWGQQAGRIDLEMGLLYTDGDDYLVTAGLLVRNDNLDSPVIISIGTRAYYGDVTDTALVNYQAAALTIGGELLIIPDSWGGIGFSLHYFTAPGVVSFMDAESLTEFGGRLEYQLTPQASIFIGYQKIVFEYGTTETEIEIDSGAFLVLVFVGNLAGNAIALLFPD